MADLVDIALKEVGYKESGNNRTKFGEYTGTNGVSFFRIVVCKRGRDRYRHYTKDCLYRYRDELVQKEGPVPAQRKLYPQT